MSIDWLKADAPKNFASILGHCEVFNLRKRRGCISLAVNFKRLFKNRCPSTAIPAEVKKLNTEVNLITCECNMYLYHKTNN